LRFGIAPVRDHDECRLHVSKSAFREVIVAELFELPKSVAKARVSMDSRLTLYAR